MKKLSLALLVSASFISVNASARGTYRPAVPNSDFNNCQTCHLQGNGGANWNTFGDELKNDMGKYFDGGAPNWAAICPEDFDGDGASNGVELGDPDCKFPGEAAGAFVSDPADADSKPAENNNNNNGTNNGTTAGNNGTTAGNNGTTAGNNGTTAGGNNGTTAGGNNGTTAGGNNNTSGGNNNTGGNTAGTNGDGGSTDDDGCSSTGSNPGQFSLIALLGLVFLGRKRRK